MLTVVDGMRTRDGANNAIDLAAQSVTAQVNTTSVDMRDFSSLLVHGQCNAITGSGVGTLVVQESNESNANFTNVASALQSFNAANTVKSIYVAWGKNPDRKRYARVAAFNTTNAATLSATTYRFDQKRGSINTDSNIVKVT